MHDLGVSSPEERLEEGRPVPFEVIVEVVCLHDDWAVETGSENIILTVDYEGNPNSEPLWVVNGSFPGVVTSTLDSGYPTR